VGGVKTVSPRDGFGGPTGFARLLSAEKQQGDAAGIEGEEYAIWASVMLDAELFHVGKLRAGQCSHMRAPKSGATLFEQSYRKGDAFLLLIIETVPPGFELVSEFDLECHKTSMLYAEYSVKRIMPV
jgi:hypothetical protein